jgi:hypothetical protein
MAEPKECGSCLWWDCIDADDGECDMKWNKEKFYNNDGETYVHGPRTSESGGCDFWESRYK